MSDPTTTRRPLGATGIDVTDITIGVWSLGRDTIPGSAEEAAALDTAEAVLTGPFTIVDTSNEYVGGRSEEVLGEALRRLGDRARATVVTKVDRDHQTGQFDRDRVLRSFEESMTRLGLDRVPILHLHDPFVISFNEAMGPGGAVAGLVELREQGLVDAIGIAAGQVPLVQAYVETDVFDVVLNHNRYTIIDRTAVPLFEAARQRGMGILNAAPFGAGILAKGARPGATYGYRPASPELIDWVQHLEGVCREHDTPLITAALHFSLRSELVDTTVVGITSPKWFDELVEMRHRVIPDDLWEAIDRLGQAPSTLADAPLDPTVPFRPFVPPAKA